MMRCKRASGPIAGGRGTGITCGSERFHAKSFSSKIERRFVMFKLIKLAFYVTLGYALYELYQGFNEASAGNIGGGNDGGRAQNLTGEGEGMQERSEEPSGMSMS